MNEYLIKIIVVELNSSHVTLYASGHGGTIGIVFDANDEVPIYDGYCLPHVVLRFDLQKIFNYGHIKEKLSYVVLELQTAQVSSELEQNYEMHKLLQLVLHICDFLTCRSTQIALV